MRADADRRAECERFTRIDSAFRVGDLAAAQGMHELAAELALERS